MSEVWRGTDAELKRTVAVKVLLAELFRETDFGDRFKAEARIMAQIRHPGLVVIHDHFSTSGGAFLVTEFIDGEALSSMLRRVGRLAPTRTMTLVAEAAEALQALHERGVLHRNINPGNLMVTTQGRTVLTGSVALPFAGAAIGRPAYLAPEQVLGAPAGPQTDLYGLGVIAYQCLAGRCPYDGENPFDVALQRLRAPPPPLSPDVPSPVQAAVDRALAASRDDRFQSAVEMAAAARAAVASLATGSTELVYPRQTMWNSRDAAEQSAGETSTAVVPEPRRNAAEAMTFRPGTLLAGRYRLVERIGAGGMGEVWRAIHDVLGRSVAIKAMRQGLLDDPIAVQRFRAEAKALAAIEHPGVVRVYDFATDDPAGALLVMEYVESKPLSIILRRKHRLSTRRTMQLVAQAAEALQAAHERGIVHRDVKPSNLLVRPSGRVVLTDFGIARIREATRWTATGELLGTPAYLAPEQVRGQPATHLSDVYALGVVAYECLMGRRPFERQDLWASILARVNEPPPTLFGAPAAVAMVLERALAVQPDQRWQCARDLATACRNAASTSAERTETEL